MDEKKKRREFRKRTEKAFDGLLCLVIFLVYFARPFVAWLRGGRRPWFMEGELVMTVLFFMLVSSLWFALSFGALFLGDRLAGRVRGLSVDAAVLAVLEAAVFAVLAAAVAWLLCRLY